MADTTYIRRRGFRLLRHGEPAFRRWLAAHPDTSGEAALPAWLRSEGVPVTMVGPARLGIRPDGVEDILRTPAWMVAAMGESA